MPHAAVFAYRRIMGHFHFQWSVQPQSNGLYTIRNAGTQLYLAGPSNLVEGAHLIGQSTAFEWNIKTPGPGVIFL